jgi:large conductance mechanosensitive channel
MLKGFKDFLMRGTVVDLAVAVVIGTAFAKVVGGLLHGVINPLIASVAGKPNLDSVGTFTLNHANFSIGLVLTPFVNFVCVAAGIYFMVVMPLNKLAARRARGVEPKTDAPSEEVALLTDIRNSMQVPGRAQ